jgi:trehalose 6-phosphate phosphatase
MNELQRSWLYNRIDDAIQPGTRFLLATDFDGTIAPIASSPHDVDLPWAARSTLDELTALRECSLLVVSGRRLEDLRKRLSCPAILAGNHGLEIEGEGLRFEHERAAQLVPVLENICSDLEATLKRWPKALLEQKRLTATVHFRNVLDREQQAVVLAARAAMSSYGLTFGLRAGNKALEIHPRVGWNKGAAVNWVRKKLGLERAFCICIGDDRTDESMFENCLPAVTIAVGALRSTAAEHRLRDPTEVLSLFGYVVDRLAVSRKGASALAARAIRPHSA